jgi:hypothetical protein
VRHLDYKRRPRWRFSTLQHANWLSSEPDPLCIKDAVGRGHHPVMSNKQKKKKKSSRHEIPRSSDAIKTANPSWEGPSRLIWSVMCRRSPGRSDLKQNWSKLLWWYWYQSYVKMFRSRELVSRINFKVRPTSFPSFFITLVKTPTHSHLLKWNRFFYRCPLQRPIGREASKKIKLRFVQMKSNSRPRCLVSVSCCLWRG